MLQWFEVFLFYFFLTKAHREARCRPHSCSPPQFLCQCNWSNNNYTLLSGVLIAHERNSYYLLSFTLPGPGMC